MSNRIPPFYTSKTLMGFHPGPDLNRITLQLPDGTSFVLLDMNEVRSEKSISRFRDLAVVLSHLWEIGIAKVPKEK